MARPPRDCGASGPSGGPRAPPSRAVGPHSTDGWQPIADFPEPTAWAACGGIAGKLYCAGGTTSNGDLAQGYVYDPATDSWTELPNTPLASYLFSGALGFYGIGGSIGIGDVEPTSQVLAGDRGDDDRHAAWQRSARRKTLSTSGTCPLPAASRASVFPLVLRCSPHRSQDRSHSAPRKHGGTSW